MDVREFVKPKMNPNIPQLSPGDTVKVSLKTIEGDKERLQHFQGVVIGMRKGVDGGSFTVRRVSYGIGVERDFPVPVFFGAECGGAQAWPGAPSQALLYAQSQCYQEGSPQGKAGEGNRTRCASRTTTAL
jgi:hypothetical protein